MSMDAKPTLFGPITPEEAKQFPVAVEALTRRGFIFDRIAKPIVRWKNGKLQQMWANTYGPEVEWREVQTVPDDAPDDRK